MTLSAATRPVPLDDGFLRDYAATRGYRLGVPSGVQITPQGEAVLFLRAGARTARQGLYQFEVATGQTHELITPETLLKAGGEEVLSDVEKARRERMRVSVGGFTSFQLSPDGRRILTPLGGRLFLIDRDTRAADELELKGDAFDPKLSPDGRGVGFVRDHEVWVYDLERKRERAVTRGATEFISHGEAEFVAAEEMYRYTGWWWSPDSRFIAYQESDAEGVEVWHVADPARPDQPPRSQFYPRPGRANVRVRLGVVPVAGGKSVWMDWDREAFPYLARVDWHARGGLTLVVQSRDQKILRLLQADPRNGATRVLVEERDAHWVNLDPQMPVWFEDGSRFLWTSEREGAWQLEVREAAGAGWSVVVPPAQGYQGYLGLDEARDQVWVTASTRSTDSHVWRVPLKGGVPRALTTEPGLHGGTLARTGGVWVLTTAGPERMPRHEVRRGDAEILGVLGSAAEDPGFVPSAELVHLDDGPGFEAEIVRPRLFDPAARYPVLVDVYGGPHANVVVNAMQTRLLSQWLADQGFVVVSIENRGTPRRGRDWERSIHQKFSEVPVDDQVLGLRALGRDRPWMAMDRVGIYGWSFGGYASALAVLKRPDVFHAAVAGAPVTDWMDYDTHYTERYLGVPGSGDRVYAENSLIALAPKLERPLLLIHGTSDDNVFFRHSLKLAEALFRAGRPFEILPLPGLTHMVPDPVVMERQWRLTAEYFRRHLAR
ncbi:MAG: DPP IV N-terminal domain-containing protein [Verrucomicrobiales bacterium]|nr:DPP IV N-terminal domain-containing protein [Verrucomicrobiales bacterium]